MTEDVRKLFKYHKKHCARVNVLAESIRYAEKSSGIPSDDYLIETIVLARSPMDGMPRGTRQGSRTESLALNLDKARLEAKREKESDIWRWKVELNALKHQLLLYNAVFNMLDDEERALVIQHYQNGRSLEQIAQEVLCESAQHPKSVSTLRRMLNRFFPKEEAAARTKRSRRFK